MKEYTLIQSMRWYGPDDPVRLEDIRQAGCTHVVTALHHIANGDVWSSKEIELRKRLIQGAKLNWSVVESLPVHENIKMREGNYEQLIHNYQVSIQNLAASGIDVITYNFMPVLDWLRTDVDFELDDGSRSLMFDFEEYAIFDLFILDRPNAESEYTKEEYERLQDRYNIMTSEQKERIKTNMMLGLPGSKDAFTRKGLLELLSKYKHIGRKELRENLRLFLNEVAPTAQEAGVKLAIHPDDPPFPVFGLPRIMSTSDDIKWLRDVVPTSSNGLCFCTGSFGSRADNDLPAMIDSWGSFIYFFHLRNTKRDPNRRKFWEARHLEGDSNMLEIMKRIINLSNREQRSIPMRPDHGHKILNDLNMDTFAGYTIVGRLKALAELRGLEYGLRSTG